jgi:thiol-disulfide isomerase/thioredoxin
MGISVNAQLNRVIFDDKKEKEILFGESTKEAFLLSGFAEWFNKEYDAYQVNDTVFVDDYTETFDSIYVFLGSWCDDSQREVPRFIKIMETFPIFNNVSIRYFCLDGNKQCDIINPEDYYIDLVPTFIFYKRGNELCRIIEQPRVTLENDIKDLLWRIQ